MDNKEKNSVQDEQFNEAVENVENMNEAVNSDNEADGEKVENQNDTTVLSESVEANQEQKPSGVVGEKPEIGDKETDDDEGTDIEDASQESESDLEVRREMESVDYSVFDKKELIHKLSDIIREKPIHLVKNTIDIIKNTFYKKHRAEQEEQKKAFIEGGGAEEDFKYAQDISEANLKELLKQYREKKNKYIRDVEDSKKNNLDAKYEVINGIKELINGKESLNKTFQEFKNLQARWHEIGIVPQQNVKDLWETYHHHVEKFYDYVKINKELRDLDLKKNLEVKIKLCEKAEELLLETNIVSAFKQLQKYHDEWREIGPVPRENKTEIWERFKETTSKVNKKHQEYFTSLKENQKKNLEAKEHLCEKAEEIIGNLPTTHKEWEEKSAELIELQKIWKTIGFAPKKDNNTIYQRFRETCDAFFNAKRDFYAKTKEEQKNNLQLKTDLCIQAEALKESTDWKHATDEFIALQKRWKEIGPVPKKHSDAIWKRFRSACDFFFDNKSKHFSTIDESYESNLKKKQELIDEVKALELGDDLKEGLTKLKEYQRNWSEIGFVPYKEKDRVQQQFREVINQKFDELQMDDQKRNVLKYRNKLEGLTEPSKAEFRLSQDRDKFINKIKQLESDITLWENNIGFFAKSKNADSMIKEVNSKIERAKKKITVLEEKIRLIDNYSD